MIRLDQRRNGKDVEGSGRGLIEVVSWNLPGGNPEMHEKI
jgi:hypothetical protein